MQGIEFASTPISVNWNMTNLCNFSCRHCYSQEIRSKLFELSYEQVVEAIKNLKEANVWIVTLGGGECLLRKDIWSICESLAANNMQTRIISNGYIVNDDICLKLIDNGVNEMLLSLDGPNSKVHDEFRSMEGSFDRVAKSIELFDKYGIQTTILTNLNRGNHRLIREFCNLINTLPISTWRINDLKPVGTSEQFYKEMILSKSEMKQAYQELFSLSNSMNCEMIYDSIFCTINSPRAAIPGCHCGRLSLGIRSNGDILPCVYHSKVLGNLLKDKVLDIWRSNETLEEIRSRKASGKCLRCTYFSECRGGCFARAAAVNGSEATPDPLCWI